LEERVKARLTGAAILVALVVLLVPELFRGERPEGATAGGQPVDGAPLRSYTINLDEAGTQPPVGIEPETAASSTSAKTEPARSPAASTVATPAGAASQPEMPKPVPATAADKAPAAPAIEPATTDTAPANAARVGWVVQLGTFSKRENAERMARDAAKKKGLRLVVAGPDDRGLFRVRSSSIFQDRQSAAALQERLKALGYPGMVNTSQ